MSQIKLTADSGGGTTSLKAPSSTTSNADVVLKLPVADGSSGQVLKTDGSGQLSFTSNAGTTINNNADNRIITGSGTASTLEGEANLTYDGSHLSIATDASTEGLKITSTGNTYNEISFDANRTSAGTHLGRIVANWDGTAVSYISMDAGDDTTNKDDGIIRFWTAADGNGNYERMRIDSSGNVGINESASNMVNGKLTVKIDTDKHIGFNGAQGEVGNVPALVTYQDNGSLQSMGFRGVDLRFATGSAERLRLDSNGNLGLGTSTPTASSSSYNGALLHLHQTNGTSAGSQVHLTTGASGTAAGDGSIIAQWSDNNLYINNQESGNIQFYTGGASRARLDSDGLKFGSDSAAANALDDYEEGSFSATASAAGYTNVACVDEYYTKIGNIVHICFRLLVSSSASDGDLTISGLPFSNSGSAGYCSVQWQDGAGFSIGGGRISGTQVVRFGFISTPNHSGNVNFYFQGTYRT